MSNGKVTYRQQFTRCGKERCHKCRDGEGHGPYWYAYWSENGRTISKYIGLHLPIDVDPVPQAIQGATNGQKGVAVRASQSHRTRRKGIAIAQPSGTSPLVRIYLLGQFRVEWRSNNVWHTVAHRTWQRRRARTLLGCLLSQPGRRLGREQVMEALWPDLDVETAANRLNGAVHELRQILEPDIVRPASSRLLRLSHDILELGDRHQIWVDADTFERLLNETNTSALPEQAERLLEEAAALYGGDYLLEELYAEWASPRREALRRGWMGLLLKLAELRAARGALASAIEPLDRLLAADATHETAVRHLMILLTQLDRRGEALRVYHRLVSVLRREYESEPLPETHDLYEALRQGQIQVSRSQEMAMLTPKKAALTALRLAPSDTPELREPSPTYRRPMFQLGRHNRSPLVGRQSELETMRHLLLSVEGDFTETPAVASAALHEGIEAIRETLPHHELNATHPHFLLLMGESGIGKTRLAEELSLEAYTRGWSVAWSRTYEQEGSIPYRPWTELLRTLLQDASPEFLRSSTTVHSQANSSNGNASKKAFSSSSLAYAKLERLSTLLPELRDLSTWNKTEEAPLHVHSNPPEQERLHLWEATQELLSGVSRTTPLLLVLDDLQWTDDSSLELLAYLARHSQDQRILLVGTCRDAELALTHTFRKLVNDLRREQAIVTLGIQPLTASQIGSLIGLVAHLPGTLVQTIQSQASGNPFFAEELARFASPSQGRDTSGPYALASPSQERDESGPYTLASPLPETIAAVLDRRLNQLSAECQSLLGKAAVLGGSFELSQLPLMANDVHAQFVAPTQFFIPSNEDTLLDLLEEALHAGLLIEEGTGSRITYRFWHPLIVSHLYERLSAARHTQLHRRAANALIQANQGHEGKIAAAITDHLSKGGGDARHIAHYAELAGNQAYAVASYSEAQQYFRLAIQAISREPFPMLDEENAEKGPWQEAALSTSIIPSLSPLPAYDPLHLASLLERVGECCMVQGNFVQARQLYERVLSLRNANTTVPSQHAKDAQEAQMQAMIWREIGNTWSCTGAYAQARECYQHGEQVIAAAGIPSGIAWACLRLEFSSLHCLEGNYEGARRCVEEALDMLELSISPTAIGNGKSPVQLSQGRDTSGSYVGTSSSPRSLSLYASQEYPEKQFQTRITRAINGDPLDVGHAYELLGVIAASIGEPAEALKHLNTALRIFERHDLVMGMTRICGNLGAVYAMKSENAMARSYMHRSLALAERIGDLPNMAFVTGNLGELASRCGNLLEAEEWFKRSLAISERVNDREHMSWCNLALACALQDQGDVRAAAESIRRSLTIARSMNSTRGLGGALVALSELRVVQALVASRLQNTLVADPLVSPGSGNTGQQYKRFLLRAKATVRRALAIEGLETELVIEGCVVQASVYFMLGDFAQARQQSLQALKDAHQHEMHRSRGRAQRLLGRILAAQGQHEQADDYFEQSLETFRTHEIRLDYARALHGYAVTLLQRSIPGDQIYQKGLNYLHEARAIFAECRAALDLEWAERIYSDALECIP